MAKNKKNGIIVKRGADVVEFRSDGCGGELVAVKLPDAHKTHFIRNGSTVLLLNQGNKVVFYETAGTEYYLDLHNVTMHDNTVEISLQRTR